MSLRSIACGLLVALGLVHSASWLVGLPFCGHLGFHFLVSPFPLVFNKAGKVETYARRFTVHLETASGRQVELAAPEVARSLRGPFTRRKVFLEFFSYWDTWDAPGRFATRAFCRPDSLASEFGVDEPVVAVTGVVRSVFNEPDWQRELTVGCTQ